MVGVAVMLAWAVASIIYLGALIEATLLVYVAPLVIAFTPLSWTFELLLTWGRSLLGISFKAALILMTLAIGMVLANDWIAAFNASSATFTTNIWNLLIAVVEAILFAVCAWKIPNRISGLAGGAAVIGFGEAVLGMAAIRAERSLQRVAATAAQATAAGSSGGGNGGNSEEAAAVAVEAARRMAAADQTIADRKAPPPRRWRPKSKRRCSRDKS